MTSNVKLRTKLVKKQYSLILKQEKKSLIDYIKEDLSDLDVTTLKLDPDFIKYLAEVIENEIQAHKSESKPNKIEIFVDVLKCLFPQITDCEIETSKKIVEFMLNHNLINTVSLSDVMRYFLKRTFHLG